MFSMMNIHCSALRVELDLLQLITVFTVLMNVCQSGSGYIINEEGQLVPFKIYKKGNHGSRAMCFLHPRNCRGGFHKRLSGDPHGSRGNNGYNFPIRKRQQQQQQQQPDENDNNSPFSARVQPDIFDARIGTQLFQKPFQSDKNELGTRYMSSELYNIFPSIKSSNYNSNDKKGNSKSVVTSLENIHEANELLNDLSRGIGNDLSRGLGNDLGRGIGNDLNRGLRQIDDSPSVKNVVNRQTASIDYPEYDLWNDDYSELYDTDNESAIRTTDDDKAELAPSEKMNFYQYGPRLRVPWTEV